eukprot:9468609-Pyramimonas_sp.AAC.1
MGAASIEPAGQSMIIDLGSTLLARSIQGQCKVNSRSMQGQCTVTAGSMHCHCKVNARSMQ